MATSKLSSDTLLFKNGLTTNATVVATDTTTTLLGVKDINVTGGIAPTVIDTGGTLTLQAGDGDTGGIGGNITCEGGIATNNGDVLITASNSGAGTDGTIKLTQNGAISSWPDMTVLPTVGDVITVSGVSGSNVTLQASSTIQTQIDTIDTTISNLPTNKWDFGRTVIRWTSGTNPTTTTPIAGVMNGNAVYVSGSGSSQVTLTSNVNNEIGRLYWDLSSLGLSFVNWEIRATVLSGGGNSGKGIWLIGGDSGMITNDRTTSNCVSMYMREQSKELKIFNATSQVSVNTGNITFDDNTVRMISLKKIGTTITAEANVGGINSKADGNIILINGTSTGANGTGGYFLVGGDCDVTNNNIHVTYYFEVRVFGE